MKKNIANIIAPFAVMASLAGCAGVSYNSNNSKLACIGEGAYAYRTEAEGIENVLYTIQGIRSGKIKVNAIEISPGQTAYELDGGIFRYEAVSNPEWKNILAEAIEASGKGKNMITKDGAELVLYRTEKKATGNQ